MELIACIKGHVFALAQEIIDVKNVTNEVNLCYVRHRRVEPTVSRRSV